MGVYPDGELCPVRGCPAGDYPRTEPNRYTSSFGISSIFKLKLPRIAINVLVMSNQIQWSSDCDLGYTIAADQQELIKNII